MKDHSPILKRNLTGCVAAVLLILFDQFTKMLAVAHLKNQPSNVLIDGVFEPALSGEPWLRIRNDAE